MGQPVVHWEFWSEDPQRLSAFYSAVFGWETTDLPQIDYHLVDTKGGTGINGGFMTPKQGPWPAKMSVYIDVPNVEEYCRKVEAAGGTIVVRRQEVEGVGVLALFNDPDGRIVGVWEQAPQEP